MIETSRYQTSTSSLTALVLCVNAGALTAFLFSPLAPEYPLAALSILAFMLAQAFFPACRLDERVPLSPSNFAQGFFWIQLVLVTVLVGYWGFQPGTLPHIPSEDALNTAILIRVVGYLAFCVAYQLFSGRQGVSNPPSLPMKAQKILELRGRVFSPNPKGGWSRRLILPFAVLGLTSFFLNYGGIQGFIQYFASPDLYREQFEEPATLATAAANFLRHFLGFAVVLAWSLWIDRQDRSRHMARCAAATACAFMLLLFAESQLQPWLDVRSRAGDGGGIFTACLAHPLQGGAAGRRSRPRDRSCVWRLSIERCRIARSDLGRRGHRVCANLRLRPANGGLHD